MNEDRPDRWVVWLVAIGILIAVVLAILAVQADQALRERHALAIEGHVLRLAHEIELDLRDMGPAQAREVMERQRRLRADLIRGLALAHATDSRIVRVGDTAGAPDREIDIFLRTPRADTNRPAARPAEEASNEGWLLQLYLVPGSARRPLSESLVFWGGLNASALLLALSVIAGRHLRNLQLTGEREANRRRLESLGRAGAGLAHQIRNPLATIKGSAQLMLEAGHDRRLERIVEQAACIERLVDQLLDFARPPRAEPTEVDAGQVMQELAAADPRLRVGKVPTRPVLVDRGHLEQILLNLISNALELSPADSAVELGGRALASGRDGTARLWVRDRGPGPGPDPESLFQPYVSGRHHGTGLGLPIARALAEANSGSLTLEARRRGGAAAILVLPLAQTP